MLTGDKMAVSVAAENTCSSVGESPFWIEEFRSLLYVDIKSGDIHLWNSESGEEKVIHFDEPVGFAIPRSRGGYVAGLGRKLVCIDADTASVTEVLAEVEKGSKNRFNDGKCDASGRLWAGTMGHDDPPGSGKFVPGLGSMYSFSSTENAIIKHLGELGISNGFAFSSDNKTMYFIDTMARKLYSFDFDIASGKPSNQRVHVDFDQIGNRSEIGSPDGMCIDEDEHLWVACFGGGRVIRFNGKSGVMMQTINFPHASQITSCCFGGENYSDLYVTSARVRLTDEEIKTKQPYAGSVFRVTGLGVRGKPAANFKG